MSNLYLIFDSANNILVGVLDCVVLICNIKHHHSLLSHLNSLFCLIYLLNIYINNSISFSLKSYRKKLSDSASVHSCYGISKFRCLKHIDPVY